MFPENDFLLHFLKITNAFVRIILIIFLFEPRRLLTIANVKVKAGPSSILGSAPHGGSFLAERRSAMRIQEDRPQRMMKDE